MSEVESKGGPINENKFIQSQISERNKLDNTKIRMKKESLRMEDLEEKGDNCKKMYDTILSKEDLSDFDEGIIRKYSLEKNSKEEDVHTV